MHMKYVGLFSGNIYDTSEEAHLAEECCLHMADNDYRLNDVSAFDKWHKDELSKCIRCLVCPGSRRGGL